MKVDCNCKTLLLGLLPNFRKKDAAAPDFVILKRLSRHFFRFFWRILSCFCKYSTMIKNNNCFTWSVVTFENFNYQFCFELNCVENNRFFKAAFKMQMKVCVRFITWSKLWNEVCLKKQHNMPERKSKLNQT